MTQVARAEESIDHGAYVEESFGVATSRGPLGRMLGSPLHVRVGLGMRLGHFAIEPWFLSDMQTDRVGAFRGLIGGDPAAGSSDLSALGIDLKYIVPIDKHLEVFVRGGPLSADANGAMAGYAGRGFGFGGGAQLTGKVRALGFLWSPLFFLKRGPMVTGSLFLDAGYDFYFLRADDAPAINSRVGHVSLGFAIGSAF
ncbi:MAG TPA: hypothetical protein VGC42_00500 [Kofleriaceae bacterium]